MSVDAAWAGPEGEFREDEEERVQAASLILRLRGLGISDRDVLRAIETIPRTLFVRPEFRRRAYADIAIPIDCGQALTAPTAVGIITEALDLSDRHAVLEIGTGSGYHTAVLSRLARRVTTIERFRTLYRAAERRFQILGLRNISAMAGDGLAGWKPQAPFDRILIGAACPEPPGKLMLQLTDSGILIAPIGEEGGQQRLTLFQRIGHNIDTRDLGPARYSRIVPGQALSL